jgi:hypothetical protein
MAHLGSLDTFEREGVLLAAQPTPEGHALAVEG